MTKHSTLGKGNIRRIRLSATGILLLLLLSGKSPGIYQQTASKVEPPRTVDREFDPAIARPAYASGRGPRVLIDEAHNNFHTAEGTYLPFVKVLERDGYVVARGRKKIAPDLLAGCDIYVIADAQPPDDPSDPPSFSKKEIDALNGWIQEGGSLFLITDHMPDPGAIAELARSFGERVNNGYVLNGTLQGEERPLVFKRSDGTLADNVITNGRNASERVTSTATFAGSAFQAGEGFLPVLIFGPGRRSWMPREHWKFPPGTPSVDVSGWYQGGVLEFGKGRVAVFAEAAMFTAQAFDQGRIKAGMNHPLGRDNLRLLRNVMHWLSRWEQKL